MCGPEAQAPREKNKGEKKNFLKKSHFSLGCLVSRRVLGEVLLPRLGPVRPGPPTSGEKRPEIRCVRIGRAALKHVSGLHLFQGSGTRKNVRIGSDPSGAKLPRQNGIFNRLSNPLCIVENAPDVAAPPSEKRRPYVERRGGERVLDRRLASPPRVPEGGSTEHEEDESKHGGHPKVALVNLTGDPRYARAGSRPRPLRFIEGAVRDVLLGGELPDVDLIVEEARRSIQGRARLLKLRKNGKTRVL